MTGAPTIIAVDDADERVTALRAALSEEMHRLYGRPRHVGPAETINADAIVATWLMLTDGEPVATAALRRIIVAGQREFEIKRMVVVPERRGTGLARRLMAHVEAHARGIGASRLLLHTGERQQAALRLYASLGYEPIEVFGDYDQVPESVCLARDLNPET